MVVVRGKGRQSEPTRAVFWLESCTALLDHLTLIRFSDSLSDSVALCRQAVHDHPRMFSAARDDAAVWTPTFKFHSSCAHSPRQGIASRHEIAITSIDEGGVAGSVRIIVLGPSGPSPLVSAVVNMPLSELRDW